jgi:predicted unusual protein kinase regulating ubiquinone biosynthesis (AarF/ABC1/UbiB family)
MAAHPKKDQIWQRPHIEGTRAALRAEMALSPFEPWLETALQKAKQSSFQDQLDAYLLSVEQAKTLSTAPRPNEAEVARALELCRRVLARQKISGERSRLSYLHRELALLEMELAAKKGENWSVAWHQYHALSAEEEKDSRLLCVLGGRHLRLGDTAQAVACFIRAEERAAAETDLWQARLNQIRAYWLKGSGKSAEALLLALKGKSPPPALKAAWQWEIEKGRALQSGDLTRLLKIARESKDPKAGSELFLMAAAVPTKKWLGRTPPFRTAARAEAKALPDGHPRRIFLEALLRLERAHDTLVPLQERIRRIGETLGHVEKVSCVEQELWIWAATTRWLMRAHQSQLVLLTQAKYQGLSLRLSAGASKDVLGLFDQSLPLAEWQTPTAWDSSRFRFQVMLRTLPTGQVRRLSELAKMGAACVGAVGRDAFTRRFREAIEGGNLDGERAVALCEVMAGYLGQMRGPAMKLGQLMGNLGFELPSEARESFTSLYDQAPAMEAKVIRSVVEKELGKPVEELFSAFSFRPFATGSVGQVHRATTREGELVAVKVQYPGIDKIIESDFRFLALLRPILKPLLPHWDFKGMFEELQAQMLQECDYRLEAEHQRFFSSAYRNDPGIKVPKVIDRYSTGKVLTSEFIAGVTLASFARTATEAQKRLAAETMFRWHYDCLLTHRYFNTDPHGGNYLFLKDRVAFVDFGNVKRWQSEQSEGLVDIILALVQGDKDRFFRGMKRAEMVTPGSSADLEAHYRRTADGVLRAIARDEELTLEPELVRADVAANLLDNRDVYRSVAIHKENAYLFKAHWGFYATVSQLSPRSNWHQIVRRLSSAGPSAAPAGTAL